MIRAILFDFDGVIVQSEAIHMQAFLEILAPYDVQISKERWYKEFAGTGSRSIFTALAKEYNIDANIDELVAKRRERFIEYAKQGKINRTPGLLKFLDFLKENNIKIAIVSGGHREYIEVLLKLLQLDGFFDFIVTANDTPKRKPDPQPFLYTARELKIPPEECLVFEDSYSGCKAGKAARMQVIWVKPHDSMEPPQCDEIIEDFRKKPRNLLNVDVS